MRTLHTSDWHLGKILYNQKDRHPEHKKFLDWLNQQIKEHEVEVVLIAGDIFDTGTPSTASQKLYYEFLINAQKAGCQHIVVIAGNHDSPSFLNAPKDLLAALNVIVVGNATENLEDELFILNNAAGEPAMIVCAVPFLRERDLFRFTEAETYTERTQRIHKGIQEHYQHIAQLALQKRQTLQKNIPILATGHLSVLGGTKTDDTVREIYIGAIEAVSTDIFPNCFDYVALGHYHVPSALKPHIRYSGSPIPLSFKETKHPKSIYIIDFEPNITVQTIPIPLFQPLISLEGNQATLLQQIQQIQQEQPSAWLEIYYTGNELIPDLNEWIHQQIQHSNLEVLKISSHHLPQNLSWNEAYHHITLNELSPHTIFEKKLEQYPTLSPNEKQELQTLYQQILYELENPTTD